MALSDYQRSYRGLVIGEGTEYDIIEEDGVESLVVRDGDRPFPRASGSIPGKHFAESKTIVLTTEIVGPLHDNEDAIAAFAQAFQLSEDEEHEYRFKNPGQPERMVRARVIRRPRVRTLASELGVTTMQVALKAADPRIYSVDTKTVLVPIFGTEGGGYDLPEDYPINMTDAVVATAIAENKGDIDAYPLVRFQYPSGGSGTVTGVTLTNLTNGDVLDVVATINPGQILVADMGAYIRGTGESIIYIDNTSYYGSWTHPRRPFRISPGANTLKFEVTGTSTDTVCSVQFRDTSL